ncbi:MAG: META domain-containing protein [Spirochaetaceae bacterium]|nr:MAG: META domain-containing protein [Spirochaetaceae bacterium]
MRRLFLIATVAVFAIGGCAVAPRAAIDYVGDPTPIGVGALTEDTVVGAYTSEFQVETGAGDRIVLVLHDGGVARMMTEPADGALPTVEVGVWRIERMRIVVELSGTREEKHESPVSIAFDLVDDTLIVIESDAERYASPGLSLVLFNPDPTRSIAGTAWTLVAIEMMDGSVRQAGDGDRYTAEFAHDGSFAGRADCNRIAGRYVDIDAQLRFGALASTRVACASDSLYDRYVRALDDAHSFVLADGELFVAFGPDSGILRLKPLE